MKKILLLAVLALSFSAHSTDTVIELDLTPEQRETYIADLHKCVNTHVNLLEEETPLTEQERNRVEDCMINLRYTVK